MRFFVKKQIVRARVGAFRQAGLTLIETLVSLAIFALVIAGAIVLFNSASTTQTTAQLASDLQGIRASVKALYYGQGTYGSSTNLNAVLVNGKRVPGSMTVTAGSPPTINHSLNGTVTVTGNGANFTVALTNIPTAVCVGLMTQQGWDTIQVGSAAARTVPVSPATASDDCDNAATQTMTFSST